MKEENDKELPEPVLWLSRTEKLLSFHANTKCRKMIFPDHQAMWRTVHDLVGQGSGLASTVSHVENVTGAEIKQGLAIRGSVAQNSREEAERAVTDWLSEVLE